MWNCDDALDRISAELDGTLTPEEQTALDEHLDSCAVCRALRAELAGLHAALPGLDEIPAPEGFADSVMRAVAESAQEPPENVIPFSPKKRRSPWKGWAAAAAAFAVVILGAAAGNGAWGGFAKTADSAAPYSMNSAPHESEQFSVVDFCPADDTNGGDFSRQEAAAEAKTYSARDTAGSTENSLCGIDASGGTAAPRWCGTLTLPAGSLPEGLEQYESFSDDGVLCYILPAEDFYALAQELGLTADAPDPDAEYGRILVTES